MQSNSCVYIIHTNACGKAKQKHTTVESERKLLITELAGVLHVFPLTSLTAFVGMLIWSIVCLYFPVLDLKSVFRHCV